MASEGGVDGAITKPGYEAEAYGGKYGYEGAAEGGYGPHTPGREELEGANHPPAVPTGRLGAIGLLFWEGGTKYDAFLVAASAQVGQVMLTLPHSFSETGMIPGIVLQLSCAGVSIYTLYLLVVLYLDRKNRLIKAGNWYDPDGSGNRKSVTSYHEVVGFLTHPLLAAFALLVVIVTAIGTCLPQIISASSNLYLLNKHLEKRTWALIFGGVMCLSIFIPNFRNMRIFTLLALLATLFTSWYMIIQSGCHLHNTHVSGRPWVRNPVTTETVKIPGVEKPVTFIIGGSLETFFDGLTTILFTFGGHYMLMEVLDGMFVPGKFHRHYCFSYPMVLFLTLPTAVMVNWAYPELTPVNGNSFATFPDEGIRNAAIILLVAHTCVAFMLFIMPLYMLAEKACRVHHRNYIFRLLVRIPVVGFIYFLAICFPYYNIINGVLGAFTTTFETFCIPTLAFNWAYWKKENRDMCPKPPLRSVFGKNAWNITFAINWLIFIVVLTFGGGFGIWASIASIIDSAIDWGVFPVCYTC